MLRENAPAFGRSSGSEDAPQGDWREIAGFAHGAPPKLDFSIHHPLLTVKPNKKSCNNLKSLVILNNQKSVYKFLKR
jgi:hypothetical protein